MGKPQPRAQSTYSNIKKLCPWLSHAHKNYNISSGNKIQYSNSIFELEIWPKIDWLLVNKAQYYGDNEEGKLGCTYVALTA